MILFGSYQKFSFRGDGIIPSTQPHNTGHKKKIIKLSLALFSVLLFFALHQVSVPAAPSVHYSTATWAHPGARFYIIDEPELLECSVGFPAEDNDGLRYFITAGHCGEPGDKIYRKAANAHFREPRDFLSNLVSSILGNDVRNQLQQIGYIAAKIGHVHGQTVDMELVRMFANQNLPGGYINVPIDVARPTVGLHVCKLGFRTQKTCGDVRKMNVTVSPENYDQKIIGDAASICVLSGDSGGAVVSQTHAVGIVSAGIADSDNPDPDSCISHPTGIFTNLYQGMQILKHKFPGLHLV